MRKSKNSGYTLALEVVHKIMDDIEKRRLHYRDDHGRVLFTVDQVIMAIMQGKLTVLPG